MSTSVNWAPDQHSGMVYLVGAGPGDPGLVTVRGVACLERAQVVIYDYLANPTLLGYAPAGAELIYAGKIGGRHNQDQGEINRLLIDRARLGRRVVRLKGGDPFVFGRGGEECQALAAAGIPFEVVPGVTAAVGAAATAGIPLTHRGYTPSVAFVTGHEEEGKAESAIDWPRLSTGGGTIVFYMGMTHLRHNMAQLVAHGRAPRTPVALIRWGTTPQQQVLTGTLADIADRAAAAGFKPPALIVVGEVVGLRDQLAWFDRRPLFGRRIMITRAADQVGEFSRMLTERGAAVVECPTITLVPPDAWDEIDAAIDELAAYDWLILTSANGVRFFFNRLRELGRDSRSLGRCKVCVVGPKTAEQLQGQGIVPDLLPEEFTAEGVAAAFSRIGIAGQRLLFPRADGAREVIMTELTRLGATVHAPVVYGNRLPQALPEGVVEALEQRRLEVITFSASSTARNLATLVGGAGRLVDLLDGVVVASIRPITSATCRELGLSVTVEPGRATLADLVTALERYFTR